MVGIVNIILLGIDIITGGIAGIVRIHDLQNNAVAGGQHTVVCLNNRRTALDHHGSFIGVEHRPVCNGQLAALIPEAHHAKAARIDLCIFEHAGCSLVCHNQRVIRHVNAAILKGVDAVANGEGAVAAGAGDGDVTVFQIKPATAHTVGGHDAPGLRGDGTVLIPCVGVIRQIGGAAVAPQAQHPGYAAHISGHHIVLIVRRQNAVLGGNFAVLYIEFAVTAGKQRSSGGALGGNIGVLYGQNRVIYSHDARAIADKIVSAVAGQGNVRAGNRIGALAAHTDAVEVFIPADNGNIQRFALLDLAVCHGGQSGFFLNDHAALCIDGRTELIIADRNGVQHLQNDISLVVAGEGRNAFAVHGHDQRFALWRRQFGARKNDQAKESGGLWNYPPALHLLKCFHGIPPVSISYQIKYRANFIFCKYHSQGWHINYQNETITPPLSNYLSR